MGRNCVQFRGRVNEERFKQTDGQFTQEFKVTLPCKDAGTLVKTAGRL